MMRWIASIAVVASLVLTAATLSAHAMLVEAEPAAGVVLEQSPDEIRLTFSEPLGQASEIRVSAENFQAVANVLMLDSGAPNIIAASVPPLEAGTYTVEYDIASVDGHIIRGSYEFGVEANEGLQWQTILLGVAIGLGIRLLMRRFRRS